MRSCGLVAAISLMGITLFSRQGLGRLRAHLDRALLWRFGLTSAAGGREQVVAIWQLVLLATAGVVVGTLGGERLLARVPERQFRYVVGATILLLGVATLIRRRA